MTGDQPLVRRPATFATDLFGDLGADLIARLQPDLDLHCQLCEALGRALHGEPRIRDIRWWSTGFEEGTSAEHPAGG